MLHPDSKSYSGHLNETVFSSGEISKYLIMLIQNVINGKKRPQSGENLISICREYYGDGSLADDLARYNGITDPGRIREGHRLRLPAAEQLVRGATASASGPDDAAPPAAGPTYRTYTVRSGDNLSKIAERELGSSQRYLELFRLNRDVLDNPDDLTLGMKLKIPRSAGG